ncbi:hypothetical protein DRP05_13425 [Archaeoglobales archaeon]|nr:MAG: hypothetical protein DRP05_13425 [Archaeoglobales archaeon]
MKCPHCGQFLENTLFRALEPYHDKSKVVVTNVDYILEVGNRIQAIIEEKHSTNKIIRGFQLVTLKKIAKCLKVPLYILYSKNGVELYEFDKFQIVRSNPYYSFESQDPILAGSISDLGSWLYEKFLVKAQKSKRRW